MKCWGRTRIPVPPKRCRKNFKDNNNNNIIKAELISVITGATGTISKSLRKYLINVQGKHEIKELQETALLGTEYKLREVKM